MIRINKFGVSSTNKTYSSAKTAEKAIRDIEEKYVPENADVTFMIVKLEEHNCDNPKYFGRFIPVALGNKAADLQLYHVCYIVG